MGRRPRSLEGELLRDPAALLAASASEEEAVGLIEGARWPRRSRPEEGATCPGCGSDDTFLLGSRRGTKSTRRQWRCRGCRRNFAVRQGTFLEGTQVPLRHVCLALALARQGVREDLAAELAGRTDLTAPACLNLAQLVLGVTRPRRRRWPLAAAVAVVVLALGSWGAVRAAEPEVLVERWHSAQGMREVRTPHRPGEQESVWRDRHGRLVDAFKRAFPPAPPAQQ